MCFFILGLDRSEGSTRVLLRTLTNRDEELTLEYYSEETMTEANEYIKMTEQLKSKFTPKETEGVAGK